MNKKEILQCLLGLTAMITGIVALGWWFTSGTYLASPRISYIIIITANIVVNLTFCWTFFMSCSRIYTVIVHKDRFDGIKTRVFNGVIGVAVIAVLYFWFDFPTRLPEDIRKITSLVFGDGLYY